MRRNLKPFCRDFVINVIVDYLLLYSDGAAFTFVKYLTILSRSDDVHE